MEEEEEDWLSPVSNNDQSPAISKVLFSPTHDAGKHNLSAGHTLEKNNIVIVDQHPRTIIHIDMDCFYAQVEMIRNPHLRTQPLGIQQKYLVVTCNYEARNYGVTKLMGIKEAKAKCPQLVLVSGEDLTHYRDMSYKITAHLEKYSKHVERLGFDENFIDVTELMDSHPWNEIDINQGVNGHIYDMEGTSLPENNCVCGCHRRLLIGSHIASGIRDSLFRELGITCCAGIAHNKLLAKLVAGSHKPNQQTTLIPHSTDKLLASLTHVKSIPGIGWATSKRLAALDLETVDAVRNCHSDILLREFGSAQARTMIDLCHGIDLSPVISKGLPQSMSDEDSFKKCSDVADAGNRISELLDNLLKRLKEDGRTPHTARLTVRKFHPDHKYHGCRESRQCAIPSHIVKNLCDADTADIHKKLLELLMQLLHKVIDTKLAFHLTLMNVCFSNLKTAAANTNTLSNYFCDAKTDNNLSSNNTACSSVVSHTDLKGSSKSSATSETGLLKWMSGKSRKSNSENSQYNIKSSTDNLDLLCNKRTSELMNDSCYERCSKRQKTSETLNDLDLSVSASKSNTSPVATTSSLVDLGIDPDVFNQLPADLQSEILSQSQAKTDCTQQYKRNTVDAVLHDENACDSKESVLSPTKSFFLKKKNSSISPKINVAETVTTESGINSVNTSESIFNSVKSESLRKVNQSMLTDTVQLPSNIDVATFQELPPEMQEELTREWSSTKTKINNQHSSTHIKKKQKSPGGTILKFFKKM